jgi:hypothetical protein
LLLYKRNIKTMLLCNLLNGFMRLDFGHKK